MNSLSKKPSLLHNKTKGGSYIDSIKWWIIFWVSALSIIAIGVFSYNEYYTPIPVVSEWQILTADTFNQLIKNVEKLNLENEVFVAYDAKWIDWPNLWFPNGGDVGVFIPTWVNISDYKWWRVWVFIGLDGGFVSPMQVVLTNWTSINPDNAPNLNNLIIWDPVTNWWETTTSSIASFNFHLTQDGEVKLSQRNAFTINRSTSKIVDDRQANIANSRLYKIEFTNNPR
jgi:hypothetical protein